ncbi:MAG: hypothetical protein AAFV95_23985 [Bacteroidota bacterium]
MSYQKQNVKQLLVPFVASLAIALTMWSCQQNPKQAPVPTSRTACQYFNAAGKSLYPHNARIGFGKEAIPSSMLSQALLFNNVPGDETTNLHRKICTTESSDGEAIHYFHYGIIRDNALEQLRVRSIRNGQLIDDVAILKVDSSKQHFRFDYFILDHIQLTAKTADGQVASQFFRCAEGRIRPLYPLLPFVADPPPRAFAINDQVVMYNLPATKELQLPGGQGKVKLTGRIVDFYGGKGYGNFALVEIDPTPGVPEKYVGLSAKYQTNHGGHTSYHPGSMIGLSTNAFKIESRQFTGDIHLPKEEGRVISEDVLMMHR